MALQIAGEAHCSLALQMLIMDIVKALEGGVGQGALRQLARYIRVCLHKDPPSPPSSSRRVCGFLSHPCCSPTAGQGALAAHERGGQRGGICDRRPP